MNNGQVSNGISDSFGLMDLDGFFETKARKFIHELSVIIVHSNSKDFRMNNCKQIDARIKPFS